MTDTDTAPAQKAEKRRKYPRNTGVFRGLDLRTVEGRRIRFLYTPFLEHAKLNADDPIHQGAVLKVVKLVVIIERIQNEVLKSKRHSRALGDELVRHENMLRRAKLELITLKPCELTWWEERQLEREKDEANA
jgi:hypothetical protein